MNTATATTPFGTFEKASTTSETLEMARLRRDDPRLVHGVDAVNLCIGAQSFARLLVWNDQWGYVPTTPGTESRIARMRASVDMVASDWANAMHHYAVLR